MMALSTSGFHGAVKTLGEGMRTWLESMDGKEK
jgi:hypothetical protein